ncbi:MAG: transglutaminase family protein [Gammaproteobacteria bacterium]|nr:transglutaminase family protein [Gammaproteobacteria bacterium]
MRYRITHVTRYRYAEQVTLAHNEAWLTPADDDRQKRRRSRFTIEPSPRVFRERRDYFGNLVTYFGIETPHEALSVSVVSEVITEASPSQLRLGSDIGWEQVRDRLEALEEPELRPVRQFVLDSPLVRVLPGLREYAQASFRPGAGVMASAFDLMSRIHRDFTYDPEATTVSTPLTQVWRERRGVCQDFAHLAIAMLRSLGLAAGYVSGYLETLPPPGQPKLVGADASHAWFSLHVPELGWIEFDPTNDKMPTEQYIVVARGRDYSDVAPLKGVIYGGGRHSVEVSVDVRNLESPS